MTIQDTHLKKTKTTLNILKFFFSDKNVTETELRLSVGSDYHLFYFGPMMRDRYYLRIKLKQK